MMKCGPEYPVLEGSAVRAEADNVLPRSNFTPRLTKMLRFQVHGRQVAATLLILMGLAVMVGLLTGHPDWARMVPTSSLASFNTAILFLLSARLAWDGQGRANALTALAAWAMVLLTAAILLETALDLNLGLDWASLHHPYQPAVLHPGRTAPNSCLAYLLVGAAVLIHRAGPFKARHALIALCVYGSLTIGASALIGYVLDLQILYRFLSFNRMSVPAAVGVLLVNASLWSSLLNRAGEASVTEAEEGRITGAAIGVLSMLAALSGLSAFAVLQQAYKTSLMDQVRESSSSHAIAFAHSLKQDIDMAVAVASQLALQQAMARVGRDPNDARARADLREAGSSLRPQGFDHVHVAGRDGQTWLELGAPSLPWATVRLPLSIPGVTLFWQDGLVLRTETPVSYRDEPQGTVTTEMRLTVLTRLLRSWQKLGETTDVLMCGRVRDDAVCMPSRFYEANRHIPIYKDGKPHLPISKALLGQSGAEALPDLRGIDVQAGYAPLGDLNLGLVIKTDTGELYAPIRSRLNIVAVLLALFVVAGTALLRARVHPLARQVAQDQRAMRAILETSHEAFVAMDARGLVTEWNQQAEQTFGWTREEALGQRMHELIVPPAFRDAHLHGLARFLKTGQAAVIGKRLELMALRKDGGEFPIEITISRSGDEGLHQFAAFMHDITQRREGESRLAESEERLRTITDNLPAVITYVDHDYRLRFGNRAFETWVGVPVAQALGKRMDESLPPAIMEKRREWYERVMRGEQVQFETESVLGRGPTHMQVTYIPHFAADNSVQGFYSLSMDISARKDIEKRLEMLARFDVLTGLPNRRQFEEKLTQAMARARRTGRAMALLFLDVDKFKAINDGLGHAAGDEVLKEFAHRLSQSVRVTDTVARLAGDEFIVIVEGMNSTDECQVVASKIIAGMVTPFTVFDQSLTVSTSIGVALFTGGDATESALMAQADQALYQAKAAGRGTFRCADGDSAKA